jgi:very-short-patch-repair endonuclease
MRPLDVIQGQRVSEEKLLRARELRSAMTPAEARLWERLRGNRLDGCHFRRQQVIDGFIVDFYCHAAALAVEVDGEIHRAQAEYDEERDGILARRGIAVLRVSNEDVLDRVDFVLERIQAACGRGS